MTRLRGGKGRAIMTEIVKQPPLAPNRCTHPRAAGSTRKATRWASPFTGEN